jgi:hypothetical protein
VNRKKFIGAVSKYVLTGEDAFALDDHGIRSMFSEGEFEELVSRVQAELLPRLCDIRREWQSNYSSSELPEEHMQRLLDFFDSLKNRFDEDESVVKLIDRQISSTVEWIDENTEEDSPKSSRKLAKVEAPEMSQSTRSIFDDVDVNENVDIS